MSVQPLMGYAVMVIVKALYFGILKDFFGVTGESVDVADGARVRDLVGVLRGRVDGGVWGSIAVAVNREYAGLETVLREGDEVALLPPVSGGCSAD